VARPKKPTPKSSKKPIEQYVVDGSRSRGIETDEDVVSRKDLLRFLGYKL